MTEWERTGYEIGWDFASFSRELPDTADKANWDGYRAFCHGGRHHNRRADLFEKKWLQVRMNAYRRKKVFDPSITPAYLRSLLRDDRKCPVTLADMTSGELSPTDWSIERADNDQGYIPGNLIVLSVRANRAKGSHSLDDLQAFADGAPLNDALSQIEWCRLAELIAPMTPDENGEVPGLPILRGQRVAPGMPTSNYAYFQDTLGHYTKLMFDKETHEYGTSLLSVLGVSMCQTNKHHMRAFRRLVRVVMKRACIVRREELIWETQRVRKLLIEFINMVDRNSEGQRFIAALDRFDHKLQELGETIQVPQLADRSRYTIRSAGLDGKFAAAAKT